MDVSEHMSLRTEGTSCVPNIFHWNIAIPLHWKYVRMILTSVWVNMIE